MLELTGTRWNWLVLAGTGWNSLELAGTGCFALALAFSLVVCGIIVKVVSGREQVVRVRMSVRSVAVLFGPLCSISMIEEGVRKGVAEFFLGMTPAYWRVTVLWVVLGL